MTTTQESKPRFVVTVEEVIGEGFSVSPPETGTKPVAKIAKRSTSLYLAPAALQALNMLAAEQGVRPHRIIDDALRHVFAKHGLDFDALNATA